MGVKLKKQDPFSPNDSGGEEDLTSSMDLKVGGQRPRGDKLKELTDRLRIQATIFRVKAANAYDRLKAKKLHYALPLLVLFPVVLLLYGRLTRPSQAPIARVPVQGALPQQRPRLEEPGAIQMPAARAPAARRAGKEGPQMRALPTAPSGTKKGVTAAKKTAVTGSTKGTAKAGKGGTIKGLKGTKTTKGKAVTKGSTKKTAAKRSIASTPPKGKVTKAKKKK